MVEFPTHKSGNTLELIFTNSTSFNTYPSSSLYSDHYAVFGAFASLNDPQNDSHYPRPFSRSSLNKELFNALLDNLYKRMNCNQQPGFLNHFTSHILSCLPLCCSKKSKRCMEFPSYYSSHSIQICDKIRTAKSKPNMSPCLLSKLENDLNVSVTLDRTLMFNNLQTNINSAFKYLQRFKRNADIPSTVSYKEEVAHSDNGIAKLFIKYFVSVFNSATQSILAPTVKESIFLAVVVILPSTVSELLGKCKFSLSADPIPPFIYHDCAEVIAPPVCQIYNDVIKSCTWPDEWKCSFITPILKSGKCNDVENYRPISILPPSSLILEKILFLFLYPKLSILLNNCQRGFRKRRSTKTQLFTYSESLYRNADRNIPCGSIYFDFSKAFDTVAIDTLLQKFSNFGLDNGFLKLFSSYLQNRVQRVKVRNSKTH